MLQFDCAQGIRLTIAKSIAPLVTCMVDDKKRKLFQRKEHWYKGLSSFFCLVMNLMNGEEGGRSVMLSYDGLLPFIAQAACYRVSRDDISTDAMWLKHDESLSAGCLDAQRAVAFILGTDTSTDLMELIASTPLSNDPKCSESTIVGFLRTLNHEQQLDTSGSLVDIIESLIINNKVDGQVIAELIKHGGIDGSSASFALRMMLVILGLDDDVHEDIQMSDTRFAVAIQNGLIDLLVSNGAAEQSILIGEALCEMSMHKKTSRALREKRCEISTVLDTAQSSSTDIASLIKDSIELGTSSTCCNCLKQFDKRSSLYFCSGCNVECYCSLSCQSESWEMGHDEVCKDMANHSDYLRCQGVSETDVKRYESLQSNVMMAGCRIVQQLESNTDGMDVVVDFGQCPASTTLVAKDDLENSSLKCTFISPVMYSFAKDDLVINKVISVKEEVRRVPQDKSFSNKLSGFFSSYYGFE